MTATAETKPIDARDTQTTAARCWVAVDRVMEWAGDRLNPILVKETRQALKSRQFLLTFSLLLGCGWIWSIVGVAWGGTEIYYSEHGLDMFVGYYFIMAFPVLVVVPFGAFRSLSGEREDRTFELMSITTLGARQIVRGKLGSSVLQTLVYMSAISPCLAFSYMLRGIDFPTILFFVFYMALGSLALALIGLLAATASAEKHRQAGLSVLLIAGLFLALWGACALAMELAYYSRGMFRDQEFWIANAAMMTAFVSYFVLLYYAAAAQLTFRSGNRSTRLRVVMVVQHALFTAWLAGVWVWLEPEWEFLVVYMGGVGVHWYVMGALMTGESPDLSSRVRRQLPQSFLGRALFTWFNPGPATGYMLAISSLAAAMAMVLIGLATMDLFLPQNSASSVWNHVDEMLVFGVLGIAYITVYLGVGLLLIRLLRKLTYVGSLLPVLIQVLLLMLGALVPLVIQWMSYSWYGSGYSLLHVGNPIYTLVEIMDSGLPSQTPVLLIVVPGAALLVFLWNLPGVVREVRHVRIAAPPRVVAEDAEQIALKHPPQPVHTSPWD